MIIIGFHSRVSKWNQVILLLPAILENFEHTQIIFEKGQNFIEQSLIKEIMIYCRKINYYNLLDKILVLIMVKNI